MRQIAALLILLFNHGYAQEVDLVRLGYDEDRLQSEQLDISVSSDGKLIAILFKDRSLKIFDVLANKFIKTLQVPTEKMVERGMHNFKMDLRITNDEKVVIINDDEMIILNWKSGALLKKITIENSCASSSLATSYIAQQNILAVNSICGVTTLWDLNTLSPIRKFENKRRRGGIAAVALSPDGKYVVVNAERLKLYEVPTGKLIKEYDMSSPLMLFYDEKGENIYAGGMVQAGVVSNSKCFINVFDGKYLNLNIQDFTVNKYSEGGPMAGVRYKDRMLITLHTRTFQVYDANSRSVIYTTKNDRGYLNRNFFGSRQIYPLGGGKFLLNCSGNNINQIYDANVNAITGYFYADSNDDWAMVSRDGRVDGPLSVLSKVYWTSRKSTSRTALESRYESGFTPKLLSLLVTDKSTNLLAEFDSENAISTLPVLKLKSVNKLDASSRRLESVQKTVSVEVTILQNGSQVSEVRLIQNGKIVKVKKNNGLSEYAFDAQLSTAFGEENYFAVSALSKTGIESQKIKFAVAYKGSSNEKPKLYLLTIGINQYRNPKYNLNYAQADADSTSNRLNDRTGGLFQEIIVTSIRNEEATKTRIAAALTDIQGKALEQDVLLVYYAGHGVMSSATDEQRDFYIVPYDVIQLYGRDEILKEKAISATELKEFAQQINAQKQVFILDACQSAGALDAVASRGAAEEKAIAQLARSTGTFWITSTGTEQFASEFDKLGHGLFTYALLEGLTGKADGNGDHKLTVRELSNYIENKVPELSEQLKGSPQFPSAYSFGNDFPIMLYK
ncbi:MAG: caspase family protein [Cyclobacteriaceae bacterium]|nr:caspase family protein [Cyclobacteriaceae bacterium]